MLTKNLGKKKMIKAKNTPLWVYLAFSAIESRKAALLLTTSCILFTLYSLPWQSVTGTTQDSIIGQLFLINDWSWAGMMIPISLWYLASLVWMDRNHGWVKRPAGFDTEE